LLHNKQVEGFYLSN